MRPLLGISMKLASVTLFMGMSGIIKYLSDRFPAGEIVFFRSFFAIPVIIVWLLLRREFPAGLRMGWPFGHLMRGLFGATSMGLSFAALAFLPLPEATAIGYAAPLLMVLFAAWFLGETVHRFRITSVGIGLVGVLIVLAPDLAALFGQGDRTAAVGAGLALVSAVLAAVAQTWVSHLVQRERVPTVVFYFSTSATLLSLLTLPWGWVRPDVGEAALLVSAGVIGGLAQALLTSSYREADASLIAPFEYASMVLAIGVGYLVFAEVPGRQTLIGAAIIVAAGLLIIWRERQLGIQRARQRKALSPGGR